MVEGVAEYTTGSKVSGGGTDETDDKMICPIQLLTATQGYMAKCIAEKCAWWYGYSCALLVITESLNMISIKFTRDF